MTKKFKFGSKTEKNKKKLRMSDLGIDQQWHQQNDDNYILLVKFQNGRWQ
jgi:hypothetical protein